jgi:hypothetical protein
MASLMTQPSEGWDSKHRQNQYHPRRAEPVRSRDLGGGEWRCRYVRLAFDAKGPLVSLHTPILFADQMLLRMPYAMIARPGMAAKVLAELA